jgi:hypothetical protein
MMRLKQYKKSMIDNVTLIGYTHRFKVTGLLYHFYLQGGVHSPQYEMLEIQAARNTFSFVKTSLTKENECCLNFRHFILRGEYI